MIAINQTMWTQDMHDDCCRGGGKCRWSCTVHLIYRDVVLRDGKGMETNTRGLNTAM